MATRRYARFAAALAVFGAGYALGAGMIPGLVPQAVASPAPQAQSTDRVFELRTYTAPEGKLDDLLRRFRDHTLRIFERHGMTNVGYWLPQDEELRQNTLTYLLAYPSREAADRAWEAFRADPEWQRVAEESQRDGRIVSNVESVFLEPTDFSPMR